MSHDTIKIPEFRVKYKDVFSLRNLYLMLHFTLIEEGWVGSDGEPDGSDVETLYSENVYQKGIHKGGKEMWFWWRVHKTYGGKYSSYIKNYLEIDAHVVYSQNVEIVHQGKKMTAQNCEIEMFFRPRIELDEDHKWANHWMLKHLKPIYHNRILHPELDKREKELWRDVYYIQSKVKQFLQLKTFVQTPEPFFARQYGYEN